MSAPAIIDAHSRDALNTTVSHHLTTNLPPEILGEIFKTYTSLPSSSSLWDDSTVLSHPTGDSPVILGQICSYWRNVALGTPSLWSSIFIEYPTPDHVDLVRMWLDRAGTCPLSLALRDWLDSSNRGCSEGTEAILKMFVEKSRWWRNLDLVIELRHSSILDSLEWDACPNLETASVCARYWNKEALDTFWSKLHRSPSLRQVDWYRAFKGGLPHAPWAQLQQIKTLSVLSDVDVVFLLQACPELHSLDIHYTSSASFIPPSSVCHDHLESLILNVASESTPLFDHISLPSLRILHLNNGYGFALPHADEAIGKPVEGCLQRSQCSLDDLEIIQFDHGHNLDEFLQHLLYVPATRNLSHFDLYPMRNDIVDLDAMAKHPSQCVREIALAMEKALPIQPCEVALDLAPDTAFFNEEFGVEWKSILSPLVENDDMTSVQYHLAQLHADE